MYVEARKSKIPNFSGFYAYLFQVHFVYQRWSPPISQHRKTRYNFWNLVLQVMKNNAFDTNRNSMSEWRDRFFAAVGSFALRDRLPLSIGRNSTSGGAVRSFFLTFLFTSFFTFASCGQNRFEAIWRDCSWRESFYWSKGQTFPTKTVCPLLQ